MFKRKLTVSCLAVIVLGAAAASTQEYANAQGLFLSEPVAVELSGETTDQLCSDSEFGIEFYCQADWKWRRLEDALLIIISADPTITFTITKTEFQFRYLSQLTKSFFEDRKLYADGFQTEQVSFGDDQAVHVKAYSKNYTDIRLSHYYYIHHNNVYGTLFSVYPSGSWDESKFLIKKIVDSFRFTGQQASL